MAYFPLSPNVIWLEYNFNAALPHILSFSYTFATLAYFYKTEICFVWSASAIGILNWMSNDSDTVAVAVVQFNVWMKMSTFVFRCFFYFFFFLHSFDYSDRCRQPANWWESVYYFYCVFLFFSSFVLVFESSFVSIFSYFM